MLEYVPQQCEILEETELVRMDQSTLRRLLEDACSEASADEETSTQELVIRLLEQWAQSGIAFLFRPAAQSTQVESCSYVQVADSEDSEVLQVPGLPPPAPGKHKVTLG